MRVLAVILCSALLLPLAASAQGFGAPKMRAESKEGLSLYAYRFDHQKAAEALPVVQRLLSSRGTVELRPERENTLVIRDSLTSLSRIIPMLRRFDHPIRALDLEVLVVKAHRIAFSPAVQVEDLPDHLDEYFRKLLPYSTYEVLARTELQPMEGQQVMYELGGGYSVSFRMGTILEGKLVKLRDFRIAGGQEADRKQLLHSTVSLNLDQPLALGLASTEASSTALMVVLTPNPGRLSKQRKEN